MEVIGAEEPVVAWSEGNVFLSDIGVALAVRLASDFVVVVTEYKTAGVAVKTPRVKFPSLIRLEVLSFDASVAGFAQ